MIVRKRLHQAGLADPRLATDEHNGPGASPRFHERRIQHLEIRRALEQVHAVIVPQYSGCSRVRRGAGPLRRLRIASVARPGRFVSNGAYRLDAWIPGSMISLRRNEHYWNNAATSIDVVNYHVLVQDSSELNLYRSGELHITSGCSTSGGSA